MKRIFNLILIALCVIGYTSCNDDEGIEYIQESTIKIISRDVSFPAAASQGSIVVEAPGAITVTTSDQGWCTTSVSGSTIQVNVEENPGLEGRNSMLTIHCDGDSTAIAIQQSGVIFQLSAGSQIMVNNEAKTYSYDLVSNVEIALSTSEDWISVKVEEGKLNITLTENNTGHLRNGSIAYAAGAYKDKIEVTQCEFDKDLAGEYQFFFIDTKDGKTKYLNATLSKTGNNYILDLPDMGFKIPVIYNQNAGTLSVKGGQYMGDLQTYKVHTALWDITEGYLSWSNAVSMSARFEYLEEDGVGYTLASFVDDGSWGTYHPDALRFEAFSSMELSSSTRVGLLMGLLTPQLQRAHVDGGAQTASFSMARNAVKVDKILSLK